MRFTRWMLLGFVAVTLLASPSCSTGVKAGGRLGADAHVKWDNGPDVGGGVTLPDVSVNGSAVPGALPGTKAAPPAVIVAPPAPVCGPDGCGVPHASVGPTLEEISRAVVASLEPTLKDHKAAIESLGARVAANESKPVVAADPDKDPTEVGSSAFWRIVKFALVVAVLGFLAFVVVKNGAALLKWLAGVLVSLRLTKAPKVAKPTPPPA